MGTMDELINPAAVRALSGSLTAVTPDALERVRERLDGLRLRERVDLVRDALLADIPGDYPTLERVMREALAQPAFTGWIIWPVTEAVTARALASGSTDDFDSAMALLATLTPRLSAEFAIRDLIVARPERALATMATWTGHENEHVRRLASEGSRAFLPWARRVPWLVQNPRATRMILDATYRDPSDYVRRSAANHLNDLSRIDAALVTEIAAGWAAQPNEHTAWGVRHALRTLVKRADPAALALVGFAGTELVVSAPVLGESTIAWGGDFQFTAQVTNAGSTEANAAIDYVVGFVRANGSVSEKTFKLAVRRIAPGETVTVTKAHSFRPITTRTYYPGQHSVAVQANGIRSDSATFLLSA